MDPLKGRSHRYSNLRRDRVLRHSIIPEMWVPLAGDLSRTTGVRESSSNFNFLGFQASVARGRVQLLGAPSSTTRSDICTHRDRLPLSEAP